MNLLKKNQVIIYTFALMLITAGYLNYTSKTDNNTLETSSKEVIQENICEKDNNSKIENESIEEEKESETEVETETNNTVENVINNTKTADIGDATLVSSSDVTQEDYFAKSKLDRENMYSQMIESYEKILNSNNSLETQKQSATQEITKINDTKNSIMICENLIKTKGFENCVVFVNGESVSVIIKADSLKNEEVAQIQNIISRELNVEVENIHIASK